MLICYVLVHHVLHILLINITSFVNDCLLITLIALPNIVALIGEMITACELKVCAWLATLYGTLVRELWL